MIPWQGLWGVAPQSRVGEKKLSSTRRSGGASRGLAPRVTGAFGSVPSFPFVDHQNEFPRAFVSKPITSSYASSQAREQIHHCSQFSSPLLFKLKDPLTASVARSFFATLYIQCQHVSEGTPVDRCPGEDIYKMVWQMRPISYSRELNKFLGSTPKLRPEM